MPDFAIADAHLHLWDPGRFRYSWLDNLPLLNRAYLAADYRAASGPVPVDRMVFVQCECEPSQALQEARWVGELARHDPRIAGIVAWAPLETGLAARAHLVELAQNPLVKGVRRIVQYEPDPGFCLRPDFVKGVQLLAEFGLSFDLCLKGPDQTANVIQLVRQCPQVRFVLDHIGKPFIKDRRREPWGAHLRELAALDNVWCKLSGLVVEADMARWAPEDLRPYVDHVLECFGSGRVMFGSDWPVILQAAQIPQWVEVLEALTSALSPGEKGRLFHDNALAFYRLALNCGPEHGLSSTRSRSDRDAG
jgi:predicted TIM-barrel fold metal-dependent hydrolase